MRATNFLVDKLGVSSVAARFSGVAAYHDSCSGLRELGVHDQPRKLLASVEGLSLVELTRLTSAAASAERLRSNTASCRTRSSRARATKIVATGADTLLAGDLGCLMNMAGKLQRAGKPVKARHVAEVLAGMTDEPAIGEPAEGEAK